LREEGSAAESNAISDVYLKNIYWENPDKDVNLIGADRQRNISDVTFEHCVLGDQVLSSIDDLSTVEWASGVTFLP